MLGVEVGGEVWVVVIDFGLENCEKLVGQNF